MKSCCAQETFHVWWESVTPANAFRIFDRVHIDRRVRSQVFRICRYDSFSGPIPQNPHRHGRLRTPSHRCPAHSLSSRSIRVEGRWFTVLVTHVSATTTAIPFSQASRARDGLLVDVRGAVPGGVESHFFSHPSGDCCGAESAVESFIQDMRI
jgi:hypothetical protein